MHLQPSQYKEIEIMARHKWNPTNIEILAGEEYRFDVTGTRRDIIIKTSADGFSNFFMDLYASRKRSKENKWFALMGSLEQNENKLFLIGKENTIEFDESGTFYCLAKDDKHFYWNNFGSVKMKIKRIK